MGDISAKDAPTNLIYMTYDGNFEKECESTIKDIRYLQNMEESASTEANVSIILDTTVMHSQGGGQPFDQGFMKVALGDNEKNVSIKIIRVEMNKETKRVNHYGITELAQNEAEDLIGKKVHVSIDEDRRQILSECHTSGHLVDATMSKVGLNFLPTKGYHFLESPYVEYKGIVEPKDRSKLTADLKMAFKELIDQDLKTEIQYLTKEEADALCNRTAKNFDFSNYEENELIRIVTVGGMSCPCGGTHVKSTLELKGRGWEIVGLKQKKDLLRVKYAPKKK